MYSASVVTLVFPVCEIIRLYMEINKEINDRIDEVIKSNEKYATLIVILSVAIFIIGISTAVYGIIIQNVFVVIPSTIITSLLYWPINKIDQIRKENTALAAVPTLIATLPKEDAAQELSKLLEKLF